MRAVERVESQHLRAVRALAEAVERGGGLGVCERSRKVELGQRCLGRLQMGAENPALVTAAQVQCPGSVRLVLEHLAADEAQCLLERGTGEPGRFAR